MTTSLEMIERVVKGEDSKDVVKQFLEGTQEDVEEETESEDRAKRFLSSAMKR